MHGKVFIEDFVIQCVIGVTDEEKINRQDIVVSIFMYINPGKASKTDNINDTVSYSTIRSQILELAKNSKFNLLETLASQIANICLQDHHVKKVKVIVRKPNRYRDVKAVGVVIKKER